MFLTRALTTVLLLAAGSALAQRDATQGALARLEEILPSRLSDGALSMKELAPVLVVSTQPAFERTRAWFPAAAISSLARVFGPGALRACEACMAQRLSVVDGRLEQLSTSLTVAELNALDDVTRGTSSRAVTAVYLDETIAGVAVRIIDLRNGRILVAENVDEQLKSIIESKKSASLSSELERRARGDSLTHLFVDIGIGPQQHVSIDWLEQWGPDNCNLSGFSISGVDPVLGLGVSYFRAIPAAFNLLVGAKFLVSVPNAIAGAFNNNGEPPNLLGDNTFTAAAQLRLPLFKTNYALFASLSTNGRVSFGVSLLNFSLLPVLP